MNTKEMAVDFLVIGSGLAGLMTALKLKDSGRVVVVTKGELFDGATRYAQGGIAAVTDPQDSFDRHIRDTILAGDGLCVKDVVKFVVEEGPLRIKELVDQGVPFSLRQTSGDEPEAFDLGLEGGHSKRRILHVEDHTGETIHQTLLNKIRKETAIVLLEHHVAVDLLSSRHYDLGDEEACYGAYVLDKKSRNIITLRAKATILATGGAGKIYLHTTNPSPATGDGMAMAYRAYVPLVNMEFVQFHPTSFYHSSDTSFLITEALRGEGGVLKLMSGEPFMGRYHRKRELAPRDIVARAIDRELKKTGDPYVLLDISHRSAGFVRRRFPVIYKRCLEAGIDITKAPIPVVPAAHYFCGGVDVNEWGETNLPRLFAVGETAHTGLHGANRLASNSLLECLVFANRAARRASEWGKRPLPKVKVPRWNPGQAKDPDEQVVISQNWDEIRRLMWNYVGIERTNKRLVRALRRIDLLSQEIREYYWDFLVTAELLELRNIAIVSELVIRSALARKESRGLHWNSDYPEKKDTAWKKLTIIQNNPNRKGSPLVSFRPLISGRSEMN